MRCDKILRTNKERNRIHWDTCQIKSINPYIRIWDNYPIERLPFNRIVNILSMRDSVADCGMNRVEFTDVGRCNVSGWNGAKSRGKTIRDRATCKTKNAILICPTSWTTLVNMYDARVSCYMWSMSRIIFIRHNEHDFLVPRLRNNGLEVVKGGLDLLTNFSLSLSLSLSLCVCSSFSRVLTVCTSDYTKLNTETKWSYMFCEKPRV